MDINAMTLVYFNESRRRRKDSGMTMILHWTIERKPHVQRVGWRLGALT